MANLTVGPGTQVTLHFALKLTDGQVIDSTFENDPAIFLVGDGNLLAGFEQVLLGLTAGDHQTFVIAPENGFGQVNPNNVQQMAPADFADIDLEVGLVFAFANAQDTEVPGVVTAFDDRQVTVDFNHPLAGETIHFEVHVLAVKPVVTH